MNKPENAANFGKKSFKKPLTVDLKSSKNIKHAIETGIIGHGMSWSLQQKLLEKHR